jgi:two-component system response regulator FlrC
LLRPQRDRACPPPANDCREASMQVLILAAGDDALERARQLEALGIAFHRVADLAQARVALQAGPRIDAILIDAATDITRSGFPAAATSEPCAAFMDDAAAKGFLMLRPESGLIDAVTAELVNNSSELVSEDIGMRQLLAVARQIAPTDASVLITGESGTGNRRCWRAICIGAAAGASSA